MSAICPSIVKTKLYYSFFVLASLAVLTEAARAVVGFTVMPSSVSNTYSGNIMLQITGLTSGETVVIQKFLDANSNGVIDGADMLWQQFQLTDGQASVIGVVTNFNVPGDTETTPGRITARLNFQRGDFLQSIIGKYAYKLSSPTGLFTAITNSFTVTNTAYAQSLTGNVVNNGTNVPNAVVLLLRPPRPGHGSGAPVAGTVANNSGTFTIKLPPGTYVPAAVQRNYLGDLAALPVTVSGGATVVTNLTLTNATRTISGKVADATNPAMGLPGLFLHATADGLAATANSDANGNFTLQVGSGHWNVGAEGVGTLGYIGADSDQVSIDTTTGNVSGLVLSYPQTAALFYGSVRDSQDQPLAGVSINSENDNYFYFQNVFTDNNGNYVTGALDSETGGTWDVDVDSDQPIVKNYLFSQGSPGTNLSAGQVVLYNFTALIATNYITGHLRDDGGSAISNVQIYANASIGGNYYYTETDTDPSGATH